MDKKDSAVSVVIIFIMILAIFALVVATWALLGVPGQIKEGQYMHAIELQNAFGDMQATLEQLKNDDDAMEKINNVTRHNPASYSYYSPNGMKNVIYSILLPIGMAYSVGDLQLIEKVGYFRENETKIIPVSRLSVKFGEDSEVGLEGGGVFRRDGNSAHWVIMPHLGIIEHKDVGGSNSTWTTYELRVPYFTRDGDISLSTNADAVVDVWYLSTSGDCGGIITYTALGGSDEAWDAKLWQEFFFKAYGGKNTYLKYPLDGNINKLQAEISSIINLNYGIRLK